MAKRRTKKTTSATEAFCEDRPTLSPMIKLTLITFFLDVSASMGVVEKSEELPRLELLKKAFEQILATVRVDPVVARSAQISFVTFGGSATATSFCSIEECEVPSLIASGNTPMCEGINLGFDHIDDELRVLSDSEQRFNVPTGILIADGRSTESAAFIKETASRVKRAINSGNLYFHCWGVHDSDVATMLEQGFPASKLPSSFEELIMIVSASIKAASRGQNSELFGE